MTAEVLFDWTQEIQALFAEYMAIQSYTNTRDENRVVTFLRTWFEGQTYFTDHPEFWGLEAVENDPLNRQVIWGMVKGHGERTVVLIHHYDVVDVEEYESVKADAHDVNQINQRIREMIHKFDQEAVADLNSGQWQFGRGSADMKAGGAIELALLKKYALESDFQGNVLVCCLPDEENISAGMRSATGLLSKLKHRFQLDYQLMINTEPHQRLYHDTGVLYEGSIGKLMPIVYARGSLAHVGRVFEGFNPLHLVSELVVRSELNLSFSDGDDDEAAPPPSWLYLRDRKEQYDVSIPTVVCAYLSVLTIRTKPEAFLKQFTSVAKEAFQTVIDRMSQSHRRYLERTRQPEEALPWEVNVKLFSELVREALEAEKERFRTAYHSKLAEVDAQVRAGRCSLVESSFELIEFCLQFVKDKSPLLVIGISPPYYPDVTNGYIRDLPDHLEGIGSTVAQYAEECWQQPYVVKKYYTGISDLSYSAVTIGRDDVQSISDNMPLWGNSYRVPFDTIRKIEMPSINIGPWGKDFHKITERVYKEDLYERTPLLIDFTIKHILSGG